MSKPNNQNYLEKVLKGLRNSQRAWQPGPPGLSRPQPPPQVIQENETAGNSLLRAINQERETGLPAGDAPLVPAPAQAAPLVPAQALNPYAAPFVPASAQAAPLVPAQGFNPYAAPFVPAPAQAAPLVPAANAQGAANQPSGGKRKRNRKSRKTRKTRKVRKSRRYHK
jgi:hypothetical protein